MNWRRNWRILLLAVLVVASGVALFAPTGDGGQAGPAGVEAATGDNASTGGNLSVAPNGSGNGTTADGTGSIGTEGASGDGLTNLQFGLELSGGTRLRADLVGVTAENVPMTADTASDVEQQVAENLGLDPINVTTRLTTADRGTVELYTGEYTTEDAETIREAISATGADASGVTVNDGLTDQTWEGARDILRDKINRGGLTGGTADLITTPGGENFLVVEVPNADRQSVVDLVGDPGRVQIVATYPEQTDNGTVYREQQVLEGDDLTEISPPRQGEGTNPPYVGVNVREGQAAQRFARVMNERGFTDEGISSCRWNQNREEPGYCLQTIVDGEVVYAAGMSQGLGDIIRDGSWVDSRQMSLETTSFQDAQELQIHLQAGALPTDLDIQSQNYLEPSLAQKFKPLALLTGIVAWLVVAGVIFYRYREIRIAVPMLLTAFAEVWLLLGFAAAVGLALDLSHIAGLIAVIGTGVDDLVIIADEIMQRGEIATDRVFKSRFRKAFWVIGAAAITTIIAMSPLAVLSLGDLQGFAIVTIVGVLIGVLITRPAYGDVLRNLLIATPD